MRPLVLYSSFVLYAFAHDGDTFPSVSDTPIFDSSPNSRALHIRMDDPTSLGLALTRLSTMTAATWSYSSPSSNHPANLARTGTASDSASATPFPSSTTSEELNAQITTDSSSDTTSSQQNIITTVGINTCFFFASAPYLPLTCNPTKTCTTRGNYKGCCRDSTDCQQETNFMSACYDSTLSADPSAGILNCATIDDSPYCVTYLWSTTASPGKTITQFNCDTKQHSGPRWVLPGLPGAVETSTGTLTIDSSISATAGITSVVIVPTGTSTTSSGSVVDNGSRNGEIAGAVMGGIALIGVVFLGGWLVRKNRHGIISKQELHHELPTTEC